MRLAWPTLSGSYGMGGAAKGQHGWGNQEIVLYGFGARESCIIATRESVWRLRPIGKVNKQTEKKWKAQTETETEETSQCWPWLRTGHSFRHTFPWCISVCVFSFSLLWSERPSHQAAAPSSAPVCLPHLYQASLGLSDFSIIFYFRGFFYNFCFCLLSNSLEMRSKNNERVVYLSQLVFVFTYKCIIHHTKCKNN